MRPKTGSEIQIMREGGKILAELIEKTARLAEPGLSTKQLAEYVEKQSKKLGVIPATKGFEGFPEVLCTSLNEAVVHGIPSRKVILKEGDVLKIDIPIIHKSMYIDCAVTKYIGDQSKIPADTRRLLEGTQRALYAGIDAITGAGTKIGTIAAAVQAVLENYRLGIVRDLVGHGVGHAMHEDPNVPNYGLAGQGTLLRTGTTIAIEPMATLGRDEVNVLSDNWTVVTRDRSLAAHFEHTVLITEDGAEILTEFK